MNWQPIATVPRDKDVLLTDGGNIYSAFWDEVDYSEFRGESIMGWNYGVAEIDGTNFRPTHWAPYPPLPGEIDGDPA